MALTQISTEGIKNGTISTADLADESVTLAKLLHGTSSNDGKFLRANNGADPTFETVNTDLVSDTSPQLGGDLQSNGNDIDFADDDKAIFGNSGDLKIYHDPASGGSSFIDTTGSLQIHTSELYINNEANSERMIRCVQDGAVEIYYNGSKKFETTSSGVSVTGGITTSGVSTFNEDVTFTGNSYNVLWDKSQDRLEFSDNAKSTFGADADLQIYHTGTTNLIRCESGKELHIVKGSQSETIAKFIPDEAVELYYDNSKKFQTTSGGVYVTGDIDAGDNSKIKLGGGDDLQIYHDGTSSYLSNITGNLYIEAKAGETAIQIIPDGAVDLRYNGSKKLETRDDGCKITGTGTEARVIIESAGDANLYLVADTDNSDETHNPTIHFLQDGGTTYMKIGVEGNAGGTLTSSSQNCPYVSGLHNHSLQLGTNSTIRWEITGSGHFLPIVNNTYDIGSSSYRVRNIYTNDLNLSNEGSSNDVDGTWGSYTIQEGAEDLFLVNKRSGKKYKFNLTEVS